MEKAPARAQLADLLSEMNRSGEVVALREKLRHLPSLTCRPAKFAQAWTFFGLQTRPGSGDTSAGFSQFSAERALHIPRWMTFTSPRL